MSSDHGLATSLEICKRSTALFSAKQQHVLETITCLCLQTKDLIGTALQALEPRLLACCAALYHSVVWCWLPEASVQGLCGIPLGNQQRRATSPQAIGFRQCSGAGVRLIRAFLGLSVTAQRTCPLFSTSPHISLLLKISFHLFAHHTLHGAVRPSIHPTPHSLPQPSPVRPILCCSLLAPARRTPHPCPSLHAPTVTPAARPLMLSASAGGAVARLRSVPAEPRAPMGAARAGGARVPSAPTPRPESTGPGPPPICCKCMFQLFQRYVIIVLYGCCKSDWDVTLQVFL
jgi:hypothetical protein